MSLINFEIFEGNSSSRDAIVEFAEGRMRFPELRNQMWMKEAKAEVDRMKKLGRKRSLRIVRNWCARRGYDYRCSCY
jgi:hypothetical protein